MALSPLLQPHTDSGPGIRGLLNRYPIPLGAGVTFVAICIVYFNLGNHSHVVKAYYTTDDGVTFFAEAVHVPPFDVSGKPTVGAMVYSCDGGKTLFVGYLYRFTPEGKERAEKMLEVHRVGPPVGMEVKRPGTGNWVPATSHGPPGGTDDGAAITDVKCPTGGDPFVMNPP